MDQSTAATSSMTPVPLALEPEPTTVVTSEQKGKKPEGARSATNPSERGECPLVTWRPTITRKDADDVTSRHNRTAAESRIVATPSQLSISLFDRMLNYIGRKDSRSFTDNRQALDLIVSIQEA
jgi:hypothetical protein